MTELMFSYALDRGMIAHIMFRGTRTNNEDDPERDIYALGSYNKRACKKSDQHLIILSDYSDQYLNIYGKLPVGFL
ncbi:hypothetical protein N7499_004180 [Penicillium canescens]|nr:hypothetical protein N7444_001652 [Penicillium canescens]KAJ6088929.1 hypothetical protein N7499_004180 [Penicillium canescens]KAJ6174335.1 hypothetical protein N7485_005635 [Penicillium canescens]